MKPIANVSKLIIIFITHMNSITYCSVYYSVGTQAQPHVAIVIAEQL